MANKSGNPLLFPALSPLDDLPSVLMPSVPVAPVNTKPDFKVPPRRENASSSNIILQPHLQHVNPAEASLPPKEGINSEGSMTSTAPPVGLSSPGESFMRKSNSKYVVPPEMNSQNVAPKDPYLSNMPGGPPPGQFMIPSSQKNAENVTAPSSMPDFSSNFSMKPTSFEAIAENPPLQLSAYYPVIPHWFYNEKKQDVYTWLPFSFTDSLNLEEAFRQGTPNVVPTDGGRYDVNVSERQKTAVYWDAKPIMVRRCSWFRKGFSGPLPVPYSEEDALKLEEEFKDALISSRWHRQVVLSGGEIVMLNSQASIQHYHFQEPSGFPNTVSISDTQQTPQVVRRGAGDFTIPECAADKVDHLLFMIHGVGNFCDLSFRTVEECVDDFRKLGEELLASHFKEAIETGAVGRLEVLPISWHKALHGDATGIDNKLNLITLRSIPKFRAFTNDTLLDVLFFTSPVYGQHIMDTVSSEMERLLAIFKGRNSNFGGNVSVAGHSLGTVILFDLLLHQRPSSARKAFSDQKEDTSTKDDDPAVEKENDWIKVDSKMETSSPSMSEVNFEIGEAGTGQPAITYPQLSFKPQAFFLMGSPVGMFVTVRGLDTLGPDFTLPTCDRVFNIFHPFDPVAYRIETLIDPSLSELRPVLIPHHKGRKRMHLELKDTIERVGSDIKNRIVDSIQATWNTMYQLYSGDFATVNKALEAEFLTSTDMTATEQVEPAAPQVNVGKLNGGRRVDYALQEKPYESFTEYIFALQAHLTYWTSEDTMLMILKEIYGIDEIYSDVQLQSQRRRASVVTACPTSPSEGTSVPFQPETVSPVPTASSNTTGNVLSTAQPVVPLGPPPTLPFAPPTFTTPSSTGDVTASLPARIPATQMAPLDQTSTPGMPRAISGRPIFDPSLRPTVMGFDPTASPASSTFGPPPKLPKMSFNKK